MEITTQLSGRINDFLWVDLTPYDVEFQATVRITEDSIKELIRNLETACVIQDVPKWLELETRIEIDRHVSNFLSDVSMLSDRQRAAMLEDSQADFWLCIFLMAMLMVGIVLICFAKWVV